MNQAQVIPGFAFSVALPAFQDSRIPDMIKRELSQAQATDALLKLAQKKIKAKMVGNWGESWFDLDIRHQEIEKERDLLALKILRLKGHLLWRMVLS